MAWFASGQTGVAPMAAAPPVATDVDSRNRADCADSVEAESIAETTASTMSRVQLAKDRVARFVEYVGDKAGVPSAICRVQQTGEAVFRFAAATKEDLESKGLLAWTQEVGQAAQCKVVEGVGGARAGAAAGAEAAIQRAGEVAGLASTTAGEIYSVTTDVVTQPPFQATAASAAAGAAVLGAGGAAAGLAAGGAIGAAIALPLAPLTFGLSLPIGAAVGGSAGMVVGTSTGAATGSVCGGAMGYGIYRNKDEICDGFEKVLDSSEVARGAWSATGAAFERARDGTESAAAAASASIAAVASAVQERGSQVIGALPAMRPAADIEV